jgi:hypothetical protein
LQVFDDLGGDDVRFWKLFAFFAISASQRFRLSVFLSRRSLGEGG